MTTLSGHKACEFNSVPAAFGCFKGFTLTLPESVKPRKGNSLIQLYVTLPSKIRVKLVKLVCENNSYQMIIPQ